VCCRVVSWYRVHTVPQRVLDYDRFPDGGLQKRSLEGTDRPFNEGYKNMNNSSAEKHENPKKDPIGGTSYVARGDSTNEAIQKRQLLYKSKVSNASTKEKERIDE